MIADIAATGCCLATTIAIALVFWIHAKTLREHAQTLALLSQTREVVAKNDYNVREISEDAQRVLGARQRRPSPSGPQLARAAEKDLERAVIAGRDNRMSPEAQLEDFEAEDLGTPPPAAGESEIEQYVDEHEPVPAGRMYADRNEPAT